jgi:GAF domain-containing protein
LLALITLVIGIAMRVNLSSPPPLEVNTYDLISIPLGLVSISSLTFLFLRYARLSRSEGATEAMGERLRLAEITSHIARRISKRMALDEVLTSAIEQIRTSYSDIYHAQIFMVDESGQEARLVASTGEIGKLLMQRQHSLGVGSLSVIGQVTLAGEALIARAGSPDSIHRRNEALPDTAVEAAFPLRIGDKVIGALDLQSRNTNTFQEDDIPAFQSLADHIAVAIDNARLFEETSERLRENQQLVEQARNAVREVERLNRQLTGRAWSEYLRSKGDQLGLSVDFTDNSVKQDNTWTQTISEAIQYNYVAQTQQDDAQIIAIPLRVRGQVIGAIEFELDKDTSLSPEDLILVQEVGERLGLAAETTRLFERSQRIAQREALVNEIGTRLQSTSNIEATLAEAARSLKQTLRADKVAIRLGTPPAANGESEV